MTTAEQRTSEMPATATDVRFTTNRSFAPVGPEFKTDRYPGPRNIHRAGATREGVAWPAQLGGAVLTTDSPRATEIA